MNLAEIIQVAQLFPLFVAQEEGRELTKEVSWGELEATLKWFKKDKSLGSDGWPVEFYLAFYDLLGEDLLEVIEESRTTGHIHPPMNYTFIALIPKTDDPTSFNDFRPISMCNCIYKIIAICLRPNLSTHILVEQFTFLQHRQIHEVVGTAQEILHFIQ